MTATPQIFRSIRAPRVTLRGTLPVTLQLENKRQFIGKLYRLSITGGLVELVPYVDERSKVLMSFDLGGLLQAKAEMLFPLRGGMGYFQPFRLIGFPAGVRQKLEAQIAGLLKQSVGPNHTLGSSAEKFFLDSL
jgi:hypothetical protein